MSEPKAARDLAGLADASGEHAGVADPDLVDGTRRDRPDVGGVGVLLTVGVVGEGPAGQRSAPEGRLIWVPMDWK